MYTNTPTESPRHLVVGPALRYPRENMSPRYLAVLPFVLGIVACSDDEASVAALSSIAETQVLRVTTDAISDSSSTSSPRQLVVDLRNEDPGLDESAGELGPDTCPTYRATGSVNGIELPLQHAGQRAAVNTGDSEGHYECEGPRFELDLEKHPDLLAARVLEVSVSDKSATFLVQAVNLFDDVQLDWGEAVRSRSLHYGDNVSIVADPPPDPAEYGAVVRFVDPAMPGSLFELHSEQGDALVTSRGVDFVVPDLSIEATAGLLQAEGAALATGISTCDGPHKCSVAGRNTRWLPQWRSITLSP